MKKIFSVVLVVLAVILLSAASYGFNRLDGTNVKSSKVLYKGEMILEGSFDYMPSIKPAAQQSDFSLDVLSIPFDFRMGLSKNREIGFEMRIDNQKTELGNESSNRTTLSKIGIASKTRVWKDLSFRLAAGYSMNGNSYYSADGIYASGMFLYDYTIEAGSILVNLGYEYAEGKFDFFEDGPELNIKNRFIYGIAYNYPAMKKLNLILEYSGAQKYASEFKNLGEISLGAKYKLDADIILTGALSSGVQDGSPDLTAKIGFQKLFGALNFTNEYLKHRWKESAEEPQKTKEPKQYPKKICPVCGYEAESDENYCPNDGTKLEFVKDIQDNKCGVCLNELPENANFCPYCGATVKKTVFKETHNHKPAAVKKNALAEPEQNKANTEPKIMSPEEKDSIDKKVETLLERAKMAFGEENFNQAASLYDQAAKLDPANSKVWYNKGVTHYMSKQFAEAKLALEKAVKNNPADVDSLLYLAAANGRLRNTQEAIRIYKKVLEIDPSNQVAKKNLSKVGVY